MADISNTEAREETQHKTAEVKKMADINIPEGSFLFNTSHSQEVQELSKLVYEGPNTTIFTITDEYTTREVIDPETKKISTVPEKVEPYTVALVDLKKLTDSLVVYWDESTEGLVNVIEDELKNEYVVAQSIKLFVEMGRPDNFRFVTAKKTFSRNAESAVGLLKKLDSLGVKSDLLEKLKREIITTVDNGKMLFDPNSKIQDSASWAFKKTDN